MNIYFIITLLYLHSASSMGSDVVCSSGEVDGLVQLPEVHGYGHGQVGEYIPVSCSGQAAS